MFLQPLDLTTALRPILLPDEALLFVQDAVGLYEGCVSLYNSRERFNSKALIGSTRYLAYRMGMRTLPRIGHATLIIWSPERAR